MTPTLEGAQCFFDELKREIGSVIVGQEAVLEQLVIALVAGGHILLEGVPGVAKTLIARSLSAALKVSFCRIQLTPDLMPADVTGVNVFEPKTAEFRFRPGPIFADIVMADEINRAPARTQAALLEAMQENQVSIDGATYPLSKIFLVVATQNPIEYEGTYPLPEAQLDRFFMKVMVGYPTEEAEQAMVSKMHELGEDSLQPDKTIKAVATREELIEIRHFTHKTEVDAAIIKYIVDIVRSSRSLPSLSLGASPRAAIMLLRAAKAHALLHGNSYVTPDDVRAVILPVLRHRVRLTPEAEIEGLTPDMCLESLLKQVAVPR